MLARAATAVADANKAIRALIILAHVVCADETPIRVGPGPKSRNATCWWRKVLAIELYLGKAIEPGRYRGRHGVLAGHGLPTASQPDESPVEPLPHHRIQLGDRLGSRQRPEMADRSRRAILARLTVEDDRDDRKARAT